MKQIRGPGGLLVWDDEYFQRGDFTRHPEPIDADEAGDALVSACVAQPEHAQALLRAFDEERQQKNGGSPKCAN